MEADEKDSLLNI
jgi:hypothetical protein